MTDRARQIADGDTYDKPEHGWTCFHCGETFTTVGAATDHFGFEPSSDPACRIKLGGERGLVMALRKTEAELARYQFEAMEDFGPASRLLNQIQARHTMQLTEVEQTAYDKGLADGRKLLENENGK